MPTHHLHLHHKDMFVVSNVYFFTLIFMYFWFIFVDLTVPC